jgi:hypothetical protein
MTQPDSSAIDQALIDRLQDDPALAALLQPGASVFMDEAPPGSTAFVIVSLVDEQDVPRFGGRAFEDALYLVKVVELSTVPVRHSHAAAARIDAVLHEGRLMAPGYGGLGLAREGRFDVTEETGADTSIVWRHRGGYYRVQMQLRPGLPIASDWVAPGWVADGWAA